MTAFSRPTRPLCLRGGRVVDPATGMDGIADVLLADGRVVDVAPSIALSPDWPGRVVDVSGCLVTPGWIDMHVHLREPGGTHKETVATGTRSAARGGFTTVVSMANTKPVIDSPERVRELRKTIERDAAVRVEIIGAITEGLLGETLTPFPAMVDAGVVAFSDDGKTVMNAATMREAFARAQQVGKPIIVHCEDGCLKGCGVVNEGPVATKLGLPAIPPVSEDVIVARDLLLAESVGARVHVAHLSTRGAIRLVRDAKARGLPVTAEATPHHLTLDAAAVETHGPLAKMAPPLRSPEDVAMLREAVADGTIDVIATDHAPHATAEKEETTVELAEFGITGLETAFGLTWRFVAEGRWSVRRYVDALTAAPARILGLAGGTLARGAPADVTVARPEEQWRFDRDRQATMSRNTPFHGALMHGRVRLTVVGGLIVYDADGEGGAT
jgi:dihydroorotase